MTAGEPCPECNSVDCACEAPIVVMTATRHRAHQLLDRWLSDCEQHAQRVHETGTIGTIGTIGKLTLHSSFDDVEVMLQAESSMVEDV